MRLRNLVRRAEGLNPEVFSKLPSQEELDADKVLFPVSNARITYLRVLNEAIDSSTFRHPHDTYSAVQALARSVNRRLDAGMIRGYDREMQPAWVQAQLEAGQVDTVLEQSQRLQEADTLTRRLGNFTLCALTD